MSLLLNIDTAIENASLCLAKNGTPVEMRVNEKQKDHATWLHVAADEMLRSSGFSIHDLDAVAVNMGPGSYTGLRIGMSAAKGICFAVQIPLITINSLMLIASAVQDVSADLICPLIDARRMEVFTAVFDRDLTEKQPPQALVLDEDSFAPLLQHNKVLFCGNAVQKARTVIKNDQAFFMPLVSDAGDLARLSCRYFEKKDFADLAYSEPLYVKEFYTPASKK